VLVAVGVVSYSLFLWHDPIILWLNAHGLTTGGWDGLLVNVFVTAVVAGTLSALTYQFVERPVLKRKHSTRIPTTPAVASLAPRESTLESGNGESALPQASG
jgi:peptidoglycan/LPS O-acetylase OafA/YrhL